ncbi:MAG: glycosyltransferase family 4 protein [Azospirillaceae bacterium]
MTAVVHWLQPGAIDTPTGGFVYNRRIVEGLDRPVELHVLPGGFPRPDLADLEATDRVLAGLPDGALTVVDGLAYGAMPGLAARHGRRLRIVALVHHPLADEDEETRADADALVAAETAALAEARLVITTSATTAGRLADFGVPRGERLAVVPPGVDPAPLAPARSGGPWRLLCVASLTPRKDHRTLIAALARLGDLDWKLDLVGSATLAPATAEAVRSAIAEAGLGDRIAVRGALPAADIGRCYAEAHIHVLATRHEGFGIVIHEAVARGLPVVSTAAGAVPEALPPGCGLLVPVGDAAAFAGALRQLMTDGDCYATLRRACERAREGLPDWDARAREFAAALARVAP